MVLGGSGGRELAVLFVYLDPDVLPAGFRGRSQRGAAAGEGIEDQGAGVRLSPVMTVLAWIIFQQPPFSR